MLFVFSQDKPHHRIKDEGGEDDVEESESEVEEEYESSNPKQYEDTESIERLVCFGFIIYPFITHSLITFY